ncbi:hypothetical protein C8J57DRAFT_1176263 [Mycena rebaudengoi]|nr:hypothetical protein C8J57DRAFT_1176263 [Mycena rebaudengoi]
MPEAFPRVGDSPSSNNDSHSLAKYDGYSSYSLDDTADATFDVASFGTAGFTDFKLDLTCLSTTPSPPPSPPPQSDYPFSSYLPSSPPASTRRSVSFSTGPLPSLGRASSQPRLSTSPRISLTSASNVPGSWPLSKYVGRGTPIDRGRRSEWGGNGASEDVAEDGVLFSTVRSTSMDSTFHPDQRSISPLTEWNYISPPPAVYTSPSERRRSTISLGPLPELVQIRIDDLNTDSSAEWASAMQQVLSSPTSASASTSTPELSSETHFESAVESADELRTPGEQQQAEEADGDTEVDLGMESLNAAVDQGLGLIPGGMTWFDVGILPGSGRASPSVYSCDQPSTPYISRPQSIGPSETKTETRFPLRNKLRSQLWWQRILDRLRRIQTILRGRRRAV